MSEYNKVCAFCKTKYIAKVSNSKYCSKECNYKSGRKRLLKRIKENPEHFIKQQERYKQTSIEKRLKQGIKILKYVKYKCVVCNKEYKPRAVNNKYCSELCSHKNELSRIKIDRQNRPEIYSKKDKQQYIKWIGYNPIKEIKCCTCKKKFVRKTISQTCCSKECYKERDRKLARKKYYENHEKNKEKNRKNYKIRIQRDVQFQLSIILRSRLRDALYSKNIKKRISVIDLVGCNIQDLKQYLEKQFKPGMTWNNLTINGWHIDHIKPVAAFDLTKIKEQRECFHYTNLQPLWAEENYKKGAKFDG